MQAPQTPQPSPQPALSPAPGSASASAPASSPASMPEGAIPFIQLDPETNEYTINEDSFEFLKDLDGPVGVIAMVGMYRTGKSYLLNRMLLNQQKGFGVGPTIQPCTKGLWMWKKPIAGFTPEGDPINVLILDSEGLGALDEDSSHDCKIFSLALLLSSFFLYNSVGSIDESALQNLSLVINLTKHIHIKTQGAGEDVDPEEYARYFPAFMWIVRDFTLQLVDEEGEALSSKDYLEKSLEPQKGFSDSIEQKNRIRRMMKSFFADRDCCTMVRPVTKEEDLQNLENMKLEELRPEFVEEIMQLRRKVINRIKPKTLNGKKLTGEMLCNLAQTYLAAINKGVVPNVENAWTYICKNECVKAFHNSLEKYDTTLKELAYSKIPMEESDLKQCHREARQAAITDFSEKSVGPIASDYMKDLLLKVKQKYATIRAENEKETRAFLSNAYMSVEKKLKSSEFEDFSAYEKELRAFQLYFLEQGPQGPSRKVIMLEFCQHAMNDAADFFARKLGSDLSIQRTLAEETTKKLEDRIAEMREEHKKDSDAYSTRLKELETMKAELDAKEESLKESLANLTNEKEQAEKQLKERMEEEQQTSTKAVKDLQDQLSVQQDKSKEAEVRMVAAESEFAKQKALYEQKIVHLEKSLDDVKVKDTAFVNEMENLKKAQATQMKEMGDRCEAQTKELQAKLDELGERLAETEGKLTEAEQKCEMTASSMEEERASHGVKLGESEKLAADLKSQMEALVLKGKEELKAAVTKYETEAETLRKKSAEMEAVSKSVDEQFKALKAKCEKDDAVVKQKQQFSEMQLADTRKQLEEAKKAHAALLKEVEARDNESADQTVVAKQFDDLKANHQEELRDLQTAHETEKAAIQAQLEQMTEKFNELELKLKLQQSDFDKETVGLKEQVQSLEAANAKLAQQNKALDQQKVQLMEASESHYKEVIANLETQMEETTKKSQQESKELQTHSEEALAQLRNFYEMEKERLENRINEERDKVEKRYTQQLEENDAKMKEEQQQHLEEVEMLQNDLKECESQHQAIIAQLEQDNNLLNQKAQTLEIQVKEAKEQASKLQTLNSSAIEQQMNSFSEERKNLLDKNDQLTKQSTVREKQVATLENRVESMKAELDRKEKSVEEWKTERNAEKVALSERFEALKVKNQQISDEYMQKKLEFNKEQALATQHNNKIKELQTQIEELANKCEERLNVQKMEYGTQLKELTERFKQEKDACEQKYEQKRKALKELEANIAKQTGKLEHDKSLAQEKCSVLEAKNAEMEKTHGEEVTSLQTQVAQLKEALNSGNAGVVQENEKLRKRQAELEKEVLEVQTNYEKDRDLWTGKFQFLEQQKDQYKSDLGESQKKFEATLAELHKREAAEKEHYEATKASAIAAAEQKAKDQLKEVAESYQQRCAELQQKNQQVEKELKQLKDSAQLEYRGKVNEQGSLEKKVTELTESQEKMSKELEEAKAERDKKILDYQRELEKEKDGYKGKVQEVETKYKEAEGKRSALVFEYERERAKWAIEKDHLLTQKGEAQLAIEKLERKKESLMLENEKLKSQRTARKPMYAGVGSAYGNPSRYSALRAKENFASRMPGGEDKQESIETGSNSSSNAAKVPAINVAPLAPVAQSVVKAGEDSAATAQKPAGK